MTPGHITTFVDPDLAAETIATPLGQWPSNCFAIATMFVRTGLVKGTAKYGMWLGPIAAGNPFSGRAFAHHGWVEQLDAPPEYLIVDPTRWVFESVAPYVYVGPNDHYDKGGNKFRKLLAAHGGAPPAPAGPASPISQFTNTRLLEFIYLLLGRGVHTGPILENEVWWLAHQDPEDLGYKWTRELYIAMQRAGLEALVPMDNWQEVMKGGYR